MMKRKLWFTILVVLVVSGMGGFLYYNLITTPKYSLLKIKESVENHDITSFERYVDIDGIVIRLLTELPDLLNVRKEAGFLPEEALQIVSSLVKESVTKMARESIRTFVERGHFDKALTTKGTISTLLKHFPVTDMEVMELGEVRKEGKICKVTLPIYVHAYEGRVDLEFMMRDKGNYWQVGGITNFSNVVRQIADLKSTFHYRDLFATALYFARLEKVTSQTVYELSSVATELARVGKSQRSEQIFSLALDAAMSIEDKSSKAIALHSLVTQAAKAGNIDLALNSAFQIEDADWKATAVGNIAAELAKTGNTEKALNLALSIKDTQSKSYALSNLATKFAEDRNFKKALEITSSLITDPFHKGCTLSTIAKELESAGETEKAQQMFSLAVETISNGQMIGLSRATALRKIAENAAEAGKITKALRVLSSVHLMEERAVGLIKIAQVLTKGGNIELSNDLFSQALGIAETIKEDEKDPQFKAWHLCDISMALANIDKITDSLNVASSIEDIRFKERALICIATNLAKLGKIEPALDIARRLKEETGKPQAFCEVSLQIAASNLEKERQSELANAIMSAFSK